MATMQLPTEGELVYNGEIQIETTHIWQTTTLANSKQFLSVSQDCYCNAVVFWGMIQKMKPSCYVRGNSGNYLGKWQLI
jgi:hypothetical protein